jgi:anti-sigma factor RsiW
MGVFPHMETSTVSLDGLSCQQIFALLSEYLDAELPPDVCEKLSGHISGCAPCVEFVQSLRQSVELCRQFRPDALPPPLADEVKARLKQAYAEMR